MTRHSRQSARQRPGGGAGYARRLKVASRLSVAPSSIYSGAS